MVANFGHRTVADYMAMGREIAVGTDAVHRYLPGAIASAVDGQTTLSLAVDTHRIIFAQAFGPDAGRLRSPSEDVTVGHDEHQFSGAPGREIAGRIVELGDSIPPARAPGDVRKFAQWAAVFVREFFVIHPFVDGNGRTARAIVEAAAHHAGHFFEWPVEPVRRKRTADKNAYLRALQYAHACLGLTRAGNFIPRKGPDDAYERLTRWWRRRLRSAEERAAQLAAMDEHMDLETYDEASLTRFVDELDRQRAREQAFSQWLEDETLRTFRLPVVPH